MQGTSFSIPVSIQMCNFSMHAALFCRFAGGSPAFLAVWGMGRSDGKRNAPCGSQTPCSPCPRLRRSGGTHRVGCGIGGQPVLEVGVVCANIDQRLFLVKPNIGGLFLLGKPCSDASSFLPVGMEKGQSIARLSLVGYLFSFTVCCSIIDVQFFKTCWWQTAF